MAGLGIGAWFVTKPQPAIAFSERDWVVVADLRNLTGEKVLDDSLAQAFRISLEQSRYVNVLSEMKARDTLARMQRKPGTLLDRAIASETVSYTHLDVYKRQGFYKTANGLDQAISRGLAYAPYADLVWCETGKPDLEFARKFAEAIHAKFPGKLLAYNCSPSFNWKKNLDDATIAKFQVEIAKYGYKFQFITLAGFHALNYSMFNLAHGYARRQMSAFVELQEAEFAAADRGFTAVKHQREVGTGYFDAVTQAIQQGPVSYTHLKARACGDRYFPLRTTTP